jgi:NADH-quinone oxidoreductase subunit G
MTDADANWITFTIDGLEVRAREGELLLEAAKRGDVEIPFFCYERKLGPPVGACRMCLIEIEGMPKLQVSCATAVKDGMVVHTQTDRVKQAQNAVVEFLLVNHPLDCPVCDKGGECPLQDISYGWGPGRSRFVEPKRNFPKPIALSPLVAIDRERCILCYRCVRFSQEVAEDNQLVFLERADHTFVGTFHGRPYVAPFSGNVIELCPVGALTSTAYRFRARPWDIENSGSVCTLCPSQCNIAFTVRDDRVERVLARENSAVDDGWLCDKGRFGYQAIHSEERITQPLIRDGGHLRPATWERALVAAAEGLAKASAASAAVLGGATTNEEGYLLQRIFRDGLGSGNVDSRRSGELPPPTTRLLSRPELSASIADLDRAAVVLVIGTDPINEAPIIDLRIRKAVRRLGAKLVVAAPHPTALDGGASERLLYRPGGDEAFLRALAKAMLEEKRPSADGLEEARHKSADGFEEGRDESAEGSEFGAQTAAPLEGQEDVLRFLAAQSLDELAAIAGVESNDLRDAASLLVGAESIVIIHGERITHGARGPEALTALADLAMLAGVDGAQGSGLIEVPVAMNARGLREVGCLPNLGPGLSDLARGLSARESADAATRGEIRAFYLLHCDPVREHPDGELWEKALGAAFVVAHSEFPSQALERHADVVFPAESYAEKEGTVTHPDGRLQRLRPAIGHPGEVRMEWQLLIELGRRLGFELPHLTAGMVFKELTERVPLYRGLTLDEIGGDGIRWQERDDSLEAARKILGELHFSSPSPLPEPVEPSEGSLALATVPDLWASWEAEHAPALDFLAGKQELQLHPSDGERLGVRPGEAVEVASNGHAVHATVRLRDSARPGSALLSWGTRSENANQLVNGVPVFVEIKKKEQTPSGAEPPDSEHRPSGGKPPHGFEAG